MSFCLTFLDPAYWRLLSSPFSQALLHTASWEDRLFFFFLLASLSISIASFHTASLQKYGIEYQMGGSLDLRWPEFETLFSTPDKRKANVSAPLLLSSCLFLLFCCASHHSLYTSITMLPCLLKRSFTIPKTMARVRRSPFSHLLATMNISHFFNLPLSFP